MGGKSCSSANILSFKVLLSEKIKVRNVKGHVTTNVFTIDLNICLCFLTSYIIFLLFFFLFFQPGLSRWHYYKWSTSGKIYIYYHLSCVWITNVHVSDFRNFELCPKPSTATYFLLWIIGSEPSGVNEKKCYNAHKNSPIC